MMTDRQKDRQKHPTTKSS